LRKNFELSSAAQVGGNKAVNQRLSPRAPMGERQRTRARFSDSPFDESIAMKRRLRQFRLVGGFSLSLVLFLIQPAWAARLLEVFVEHDGKVVSHTYYQDDGLADAATVWQYLNSQPIMVDDDVAAIEALADNRLAAVLEGHVVIRFQHSDRLIAQAHLSTLTLRRADDRSQAWFLPVAEVERSAQAAALGPPNPLPRFYFLGLEVMAWLSMLIAAFLAVAILIAIIVMVGTVIRRWRAN
jgi:hypothetical protein